MRKPICLLVLVMMLSGCAGSLAWYSIRLRETIVEAKTNKEKMVNLKIGMTKDGVIGIMGQPYKTEAYSWGEKSYLFLFYRTEGWKGTSWSPIQDTDEQFTPLCLEEDKLIGWGRNFYDRTIRIKEELKHDISIEKKE